jgi:uncharacterized membrane protein (UPF0182 family)
MHEPPSLDPATRRQLIRWTFFILLALVLLTFASSFVRILVNYYWYTEDARAPIVFWVPIRTRFLLFIVGFALAGLAVFISGRKALEALATVERSAWLHAPYATALLQWANQVGRRVLNVLTVIIGFLFGLSLASYWESFLLYLHATPFGRNDPIFQNDFSFYVFRLPFLKAVTDFLFAVWFVSGLISVGAYTAVRGFSLLARSSMPHRSAHIHLTVIAVLGFLLFSAEVWLSRFDALTQINERFTGAGYSEVQAIGAKSFTSIVLLLSALLTAYFGWKKRTLLPMLLTGAACLVVYILGVLVYPGLVENFVVKPNALRYQHPYIAHAIQQTRWAFNLNAIQLVPFNVQPRPTPDAIKSAETTLRNMRLWDPEILRRHEDAKALRNYFAFYDIDVDRYVVNGVQRMVMVGARDLNLSVLDASQQNWQNLHLLYTHGEGVVVVPVNEVDPQGAPRYFLKDIPPTGEPELAIDEPRLYYADTLNENNLPMDRYAIVRTRLPEFDYGAGENAEYRWKGEGGMKVYPYFRRLLLAMYFQHTDILLSRDILPESRLLFRRNVRIRAEALFPYLLWDPDPYIAIVNRRLVWILDGYSHTNSIPYAQLARTGRTLLNYMKNSVKLTIDAYTGEWQAYLMEPDDPIIKTYQRIYPGLLKPLSEAPQELRNHFRYPELLFSLQCQILGRYHVQDVPTFFRGDDIWEIPQQTGFAGEAFPMPPYYVQMRLPDKPRDEFLLIMPFSPLNKPNMIAWLAAHCDPEQYGQLVLYRFPDVTNIFGPAQMEAKFDQHAPLSKEITLLSQQGSRLVSGNLLVVPIGQSVMYVKTWFLEAARRGGRVLPELKLVVLAFSDKIVYAYSYSKALELLLGDASTTETLTQEPAREPQLPSEREVIQRALELIQEGKRALEQGDWTRYGETQRKLEELLTQAAQKGP